MHILVTGSDGNIGRVLVQLLKAAGHRDTSFDNLLYAGCHLPGFAQRQLPSIVKELCAGGAFDARLMPRPAAA